MGSDPVFATQQLQVDMPEMAPDLETACGLLALSIPKSGKNFILWFRPEIITTVKWAGSPEKSSDADGRLRPRNSFAEWRETVRGRSQKWSFAEIEAALELRNAVMAADLQVQFRREQEARLEAERAKHAREELMAVLSHDLKNAIGSIKLSSTLASRFIDGPKPGDTKSYLARIDRAANNMDSLINDILSVTKLEAGYMDFERANEEIGPLINEVIDIVGPLASEKGVRLNVAFGNVACHVLCDRNRIFQVLSNILGNAIKFTPPNGEIQVELINCGPEFATLRIRDSGPGIPPEDLPHIFDRFWQATKAKRLGTGLGLAIAKGIVEGHGGQIWAESDGQTGTEFVVKLPVVYRY